MSAEKSNLNLEDVLARVKVVNKEVAAFQRQKAHLEAAKEIKATTVKAGFAKLSELFGVKVNKTNIFEIYKQEGEKLLEKLEQAEKFLEAHKASIEAVDKASQSSGVQVIPQTAGKTKEVESKGFSKSDASSEGFLEGVDEMFEDDTKV